MSNTAAHLVEHIIAPDVTLRQWVLTVPFELVPVRQSTSSPAAGGRD
jgi:hypothetical protein